VPLVVTSVSERTAPGEVAVRREGVVRVPDDQHGRAFVELAAKSDLSVDATPDFVSATWEKACWDLVGAALSTIVEVPLRELGRRPELRAIATTLVDECSAVAESEGAVLEVGFADTMLAALKSSPKVVRSPMLLDREGHRRLEHDAIADAVVRAAERHEVATPATRVVADLLRSLSPKARARVLVPTLPRVWCAPTADYSPDAP
ncbi:MAG: 2-dehydropantoate 2-reductase, partial [Marmoricola sp.]|nr:2-dehydropantoate 2-reductase [Marmoricola sp.]